MPHQHAAQRQPLLVHFQLADLRMHLGDHAPRSIGVIAGHEVLPAVLRIPEFEIGHVDVRQPLHELNAFQAVVGRRVIDQRQA